MYACALGGGLVRYIDKTWAGLAHRYRNCDDAQMVCAKRNGALVLEAL